MTARTCKKYDVWNGINHAAGEFCEAHNLESWQFWALIYDLGPRLLPKPGPYPTDVPRAYGSLRRMIRLVNSRTSTNMEVSTSAVGRLTKERDVAM